MKTFKIILVTLMFFMSTNVFANSFDTDMNVIFENYLKIHKLLASDHIDGISNLAKNIHETSKKLDLKNAPKNFGDHYKNVPVQIQEASLLISNGTTIEDVRTAFKSLSRPIANWAEMNGAKDVYVYYCSMAKASWVQKLAQIENPYYGQKMLACGEIVKHKAPDHNHKH